MNIHKKDIQDYIINNFDIYKESSISLYTDLYEIYQINNDDINSKYLIKKLSDFILDECKTNDKKYNRRKRVLNELKKLKKDQRTPEWYALRKKY